ncbi:MAG: hypothetical protein N3A58_02615 [Spirochaetes bacterium]|nr:hypothetical protein [Spirochaetota bacterium]
MNKHNNIFYLIKKLYILLIFFILLTILFFSYDLPDEKPKELYNDLIKESTIYDMGMYYNFYEQNELVGTIVVYCKDNFRVEYKTHPQENIIMFVFSGNDKNYISRKNIFSDDNILKDCYNIINFSFTYFTKIINSITFEDLNSKKVGIKIEKDQGLYKNYNNKREVNIIKVTLTTNEWEIYFEDVGLDFVFDYLRAVSKRKSNFSSFYTYYEFKGGGYNTFTFYTTKMIESIQLKNRVIQDIYDK